VFRPIPILVYHRIDDQRLSTSTAPEVFIRHLEWLEWRGWRSLSASEFEFYALRKRSMPSRSFLLSFDDGYESVFSSALPVLKELNFRAICFLSTKFIRSSSSSENTKPITSPHSKQDFLSWQQVRELQSMGSVEFHSHTHAHRPLGDLTPSALAQDLATSLDHLTKELALPKSQFRQLAWPWGESNNASRTIARQFGFQLQYTVSRSAFLRTSSIQDIPRTCYDGATPTNFMMQFRLQTGLCSTLWHTAYPLARKIRRQQFSVSLQEETPGSQAHARPY